MTSLFSKQERIFIIFLLVGIIIGSAIELFKTRFNKSKNKDYFESLEIFEKRIGDKAAFIDSLQKANQISGEQNYFLTGENKETTDVNQIEKSGKKLLVDINLANIQELVQIPSIGPVIANRIVEYRTINGEFVNTDELINIKGIGEKKLNTIKQYIFIKTN